MKPHVKTDYSQLEVCNDIVNCSCCNERYHVKVPVDFKKPTTACPTCGHVQTYNRKEK